MEKEFGKTESKVWRKKIQGKTRQEKLLRRKNVFKTVPLKQLKSPSWYQKTTGCAKLTNRKEKTVIVT